MTVEALGRTDDAVLHAWIEPGPVREDPPRFRHRASEEITLSIPATARSVIAVGAIDAAYPLKVAAFSSFGPTLSDDKEPEIAAPGTDVRAALADSTDSADDTVVMSGISMAAPHVSRGVALLLCRARAHHPTVPSANQVPWILLDKVSARGLWDRGAATACSTWPTCWALSERRTCPVG